MPVVDQVTLERESRKIIVGGHRERPPAALGRDDIVRQMYAILRSRWFRQATMLRRMLRFLIEEAVQGNESAPDAAKIAKIVFRKDDKFRSSKDPIVRVTAHRLRNALQLYYANEGLLDNIVIVLGPGSYRPLFRRRT